MREQYVCIGTVTFLCLSVFSWSVFVALCSQVILPLLKSDLYEVAMACVRGQLSEISVEWENDAYAVAVVMASGGYPGSYSKGKTITGSSS